MTIYFAGHGDWQVKDADVPWAKVPRGTTMYFYTENAKTLSTAAMTMIAIERGESAEVAPTGNDILGEANGEFGAYQTVPNYTLYPDTPEKNAVVEFVIGAGNVIFVDAPTQLCTGVGDDGRACIDSGLPVHTCGGLFADPRVAGQDVVWLACRALGLDDAGGEAIGVNAMDPAGVDSSGDWSAFEAQAWGNFNNMTPDDFWDYFQNLTDEEKLAVLTWDQARARLESEGRI